MAGDIHHWERDLLADLLVVCPVRHFAEFLAKAGSNWVQRYLFWRSSPGPSAQRTYALSLVFGDPIRNDRDSREQALSRRMVTLWAGFAKNG